MALATVERLTFAYPGEAPAVRDMSLALQDGEFVALLGPSGSGKSTLLRALAGLVPHFHGGRFEGRVEVAGQDTRRTRPASLAGTVATVFQDPEDQIVFSAVENEVAFGLENVGTPPGEILPRAHEALGRVGALHLLGRRTTELSGGELQRVCLAAALALEPRLLLLDEPTSQLDPPTAEEFIAAVGEIARSVVVAEQRPGRVLERASRVVFVEHGRILLDAPTDVALAWLGRERPAYLDGPESIGTAMPSGPVVRMDNIWFSYDHMPVLAGAALELRRGEVVALQGPNGSGKTTLAKLAAGLLEPASGTIERFGKVGYLSQDPGRYLVCERVADEVGLAVGGDRGKVAAALDLVGLGRAADRHPRDLSSGERERLGFAAVAVAEPDALVLDEPTRGVDPERKSELAHWLHRYAAAGHAVLVATHDNRFPVHRAVHLGAEETLVAA